MDKNVKDTMKKPTVSLQSEMIKEQSSKKQLSTVIMVVGVALVVLIGVTLGYFIAGQSKSVVKGSASSTASESLDKGKVFGTLDGEFNDSAEGKLEKGGMDGEGTHHLVREGGDSQNVYLTSSVINLDDFIGRDVQVWGVTFTASKAGWLMDVGRLEVRN